MERERETERMKGIYIYRERERERETERISNNILYYSCFIVFDITNFAFKYPFYNWAFSFVI